MEETKFEINGVEDFAVREHRSLWIDAWRRLVANRTAMVGLIVVVLFLLSATFAHFFWDYEPKTDLDYSAKLLPPQLIATEEVDIHLFGTDKLGRDIFRRTIHGGWNSLRVGLVAVSISLLVGGILGLLAGFFESIRMNFWESFILMTLLGFTLGMLPAWIAKQFFQAILFALLGAGSIIFDRYLNGKKKHRLYIFPALGAMLAALPGLMVGPMVALVCGVVGLLIGLLLSKPVGGELFSNIVMRIMDIILSFPSYLLAIAIVAFLGPGLEKGMIAIGVVGIPVYARLARSAVMSVTQKEYVLASHAVGESHSRMLFRHVLPNILSPIIVQATMGLANAILSAAALGFLGLGAIPPEPEWGAMLGDSYKYLSSGAWWAVLFPGLAIMLSVLGFNLLGDGLRDALDPKIRL
ncbi:MAG: ABC transporter permease [Brevefilum sp.]|nr:ABC transporter permease [Brevefilum sp.]MDT8382231.1 ABC transporter permease [Brevefilum sp.]